MIQRQDLLDSEVADREEPEVISGPVYFEDCVPLEAQKRLGERGSPGEADSGAALNSHSSSVPAGLHK